MSLWDRALSKGKSHISASVVEPEVAPFTHSFIHPFSFWEHGLDIYWDVVVQSLSHVRFIETPRTAARQAFSLLSLSRGVCPNFYPSSRGCHPTISSSVAHFSCLLSFPASGFFPMSWLLTSGGQSTGASASASVLPKDIQGWFPLGWTGLISLQSKELSPHIILIFSDHAT